ncbi:NUDIX hydrolase [Amaricoccus tamworthensis]|uniref:NUDIX hydrolase n=1 Tax=Amaricoccus tamworthensis TaxID=57002 RepID=UPI003C7DC8A6
MSPELTKRTRKKLRAAAKSSCVKPARLQVGALCWRYTAKDKIKVLLVTSRETGRWVIPKGWTMSNRSTAGAAEREAWEEAGVRGDINPQSVGLYTYRKRLNRKRAVRCVVKVFPLEVKEQLKRYPESGQRKTEWFNPAKAARKVKEPELRTILLNAKSLIEHTQNHGSVVRASEDPELLDTITA